MANHKALIIDDEKDICDLIKLSLSSLEIECESAYDYQGAVDLLKTNQYHLCFTDMRLPDGDGLDIISEIQKTQPDLPVAVITAHGTMDSAITALKRGAFDFVSKPIDLQMLRDLAQTALKLQQSQDNAHEAILGSSEAIQQLRKMLSKISRSQAPVYISGPSGAGKELAAKVIHQLSARKESPFIAVNCGAIPKELMESEFFGHTKGSFTGAHQDKKGLFEAANKGTLLLDEVGDLPLDMQVKLLRAIQERAIKPIGATKEKTVDVRILSATHQDLSSLVESGHFREDLFYRLNVIELKVPSLAKRHEDILVLAEHILSNLATKHKQPKPKLDSKAKACLQSYPFPGNVRELENILERAFALCEDHRIEESDLQLPSKLASSAQASNLPLEDYLDEIEKEKILRALEQTSGNKTKAAKLLGISFRAMRYKMKKLNLE